MSGKRFHKFRALSVKQPWAHLFFLPATDARRKRVENRDWRIQSRLRASPPITVFIHAPQRPACGRAAIARELPGEDVAFSSIIGIVDIVDDLSIDDAPNFAAAYPWLRDHPYKFGPRLWIIERPRKFIAPVPMPGNLGFWKVPVTPALLDAMISSVHV